MIFSRLVLSLFDEKAATNLRLLMISNEVF
jgi:hypothetical protein